MPKFHFKLDNVDARTLPKITMPHLDRGSDKVVQELYLEHATTAIQELQKWSYELALAYRAHFALSLVVPQELADRIGEAFDEELFSHLNEKIESP